MQLIIRDLIYRSPLKFVSMEVPLFIGRVLYTGI